MNSSGDMTIWVVPSLNALSSCSTTSLPQQRKPDCVHLHQYAANSGADSELSSASVEEELL
jgi:hypothetical protein